MAKVSYRVAQAKLAKREAFEGNSFRGSEVTRNFNVEIDGMTFVAKPGDYLVVSYSTPIALATDSMVYVSDSFYSSTTSRQQNLCRAYLKPGV